ncbi:hypothetical protein [Dactylosporangium salmoneum]|uniref:hypothetical protein n=1 Tax=Dactylosporangium salmoneum TaxID=53361 RepID=UPI003CD0A34C
MKVEPCGEVNQGTEVTIYANRGAIDDNGDNGDQSAPASSNPKSSTSAGAPNTDASCAPPNKILAGICVPG